MGGRGSGSGRGGGGGRPAGPIRLDTMSDARLASFIQRSNSAVLPPGYRDEPTQRLILAAGWNGQPQIMLSSHFYESRDGSTGGFFADSAAAAKQVWTTVNNLLRLDRRWQV